MEENKTQDKIAAAMKKIEEGVQQVFQSNKYKEYLSFMSKFHHYSINNSILIMMQKPDASLVAGFNKWKDVFHRNVNKGETGISILAPCPYKKTVMVDKVDDYGDKIINPATGKPEKEEKEVQYLSFRVVKVFDISQTSGEPLPQLTQELQGTDRNARELFSAIREVSTCSISLVSKDDDVNLQRGAKGYYNPSANIIVVKEELSDIHLAKTALHEFAHAELKHGNTKDKTRDQMEIEAESVAFVLSQRFGLDTSDYSFPYIASWSKNKSPEELKEVLRGVQEKVNELIERIEPVYQKRLEKLQEKEIFRPAVLER